MVGRSLVLLETQTDINIYRSDWLSVTDGDLFHCMSIVTVRISTTLYRLEFLPASAIKMKAINLAQWVFSYNSSQISYKKILSLFQDGRYMVHS